jgi:hypothetical protein
MMPGEVRAPNKREDCDLETFVRALGPMTKLFRYRNPTSHVLRIAMKYNDGSIKDVLVTIPPMSEISLPAMWATAITGLRRDDQRGTFVRRGGLIPQLIVLDEDHPAYGIEPERGDDPALVSAPRVRLNF